ncbi:metal-dependent hydrolase [Antrihabitans sp. YC2-6]|uniref:metal-dependent hydrolase n=1 Tax=Antrihabitans sp. YC2-6 TaxID=2799498 RepID=UPI0018F72877|nr:metal-dependent hydrolase [Antrihabitans sp. YC2-6]MBJ8344724.1 metal-dependent hydrolase [Antrihabitans sp. YC2-6]
MTDYVVPVRNVRTRRIAFSYPTGGLSRHYVQGDLVMSHAVAVLSAMFPEGEDFFVRAVKRYADRVTDPELKPQVKGFIGQEVTHGREHRALNDRLREMGYPTRLVDRFTHLLMIRTDRLVPDRFQLAVTAALEHYTATVAERLLTSPEAQELLGDTEVRSMLLWHALEESEHKAVAFDVYRQTGGSERLRIGTMYLVNVLFVPIVVGFTALSLLGDRASYNPVRLVRSLAALRHSPFLARIVLEHLRAYNHSGFHPDDYDAADLLDRWKTELFGAEGVLTDHLK